MGELGIDRGIVVTNDLTHRKEPFVPLEGNRVNMYVCGITAYDVSHIGHARCYINFDVIKRYLEFKGYEVFHIQNFTDIDDKIIQRAGEMNVDYRELAERNEKSYLEVMDELGVKRASVYPKATEYIDRMIEFIKELIEKGNAYESGGNVFFDISTFENYGQMSKIDMSGDVLDGEDESLGKRNHKDFALWKAAKEGEPSWAGPWGEGRPGWHLECSTMANSLAGPTLDIHGGGHDLIFPHHENEIAQSEARTGKQFVRYWMHNGFVELDREKMSKSLGNIVPAHEVLEKFSPDALRLMVLSAHYRMPLTYSEERLLESEKALGRIGIFRARIDELSEKARPGDSVRKPVRDYGEKAGAARADFISAMDDDFNTPQAIALIFSLVKSGNQVMAEISNANTAVTESEVAVLRSGLEEITALGGILGLFRETGDNNSKAGEIVEQLMKLLIDIRNVARKEKNWEIADMIRDNLGEIGMIVEDGPLGTTFRMKQN
ncbi:MAG TPA: cysteine--tRNA ligase [bacterium]|nr:cysteine--tRNA ligase [bacterium]